MSFFKNYIYYLLKFIPGVIGSKLRSIFNNFFTNISFNTFIDCQVDINNFANLYISSNVKVGSFCFFASDNGYIFIDEDCSFNRNVMINASAGSIKIGKNVMIGPNSVLRSSNHNFSDNSISFNNQGHDRGSIIIESNVWIGANVVICPNLKICNNVVIGAGSVVTKSITSSGVYCGNPAVFKKCLN